MIKRGNAPTDPFVCDLGEVVPDIEAPFYPPMVPAQDLLDYLDGLSDQLSAKLQKRENPQTIADWYHQQIVANVINGPFAYLKYQRLTPQSVAIVDPDYGITKPSPANLWIQPGFNAHTQPDTVIMTVFSGDTRQLSVVASADQDFVLLHRRSGRPCCRFNTVDVVQGDGRVIGDGKTFAGYMPVAPTEMHGRVHTWHKNLGIPFGCGHVHARGIMQARKFECS